MKNKKVNKFITVFLISVIILVALLIFILNYSKDNSSFSIIEKSWINDNKDQIINVSIYNDVPLYGLNGEGIAFAMLDNFTKEYGVGFNKVPYFIGTKTNDYQSIAYKILDYDTKLNKNSILMYVDNYVIVARNNKIYNKNSDIKNIEIGVFSNDVGSISNYLLGSENVSYLTYDGYDKMLSAYESEAINYMAVPNNLYLKEILSHDDMFIVYHIGDMCNKYVLEVNNNDKLLSIMKKYYNSFSEEYFDDLYSEYFVNLFFSAKELSDQEKVSYNSIKYNYGFVKNMPFEDAVSNQYVGVLSNYIKEFAKLVNIDFKFTEYESIKNLKESFNKGEVDFAFGNFNNTNLKKTVKTGSFLDEKYVILSGNDEYVTSIKSLDNKMVKVIKDTYLYDYLINNNIKVKSYKNINDLLVHIDSESFVIIDYANYQYYYNKKFSNYKLLYEGTLKDEYSFVLKDNDQNSSVNKLFNYYVSSIDYNRIKYQYNTKLDITNSTIFSKILKYAFIVVMIVILGFIIILASIKKKKVHNTIKKEEKLKFIDMMTSLKNRNYLNYNIKKWDDNVIYPQAIIVIDLNHIKYINDNHGHEEGDNVIKKAASVLIVNQLENSDIIRTDGNEFLIYMVGYDEKQVISYTRKIYKELKELPYNFGAALGYSMITDDIKTIDDAIIEATIEMRNTKEKM